MRGLQLHEKMAMRTTETEIVIASAQNDFEQIGSYIVFKETVLRRTSDVQSYPSASLSGR